MAEYAWQQPDGEIAPVLATEGYDLVVNIVGDWVRVADLVKLALKPGQFTVGPEPLTGEALDAERRGEPLRVIVCEPPAYCTCPAVAYQCRKDCKGYRTWAAEHGIDSKTGEVR